MSVNNEDRHLPGYVSNRPTSEIDAWGLFDGAISPRGPGTMWGYQPPNVIPCEHPPAQINTIAGALWHFWMGVGSPAVIGPKLQKDLQKFQISKGWPRADEPSNLTVDEWTDWNSSPSASFNAAFIFGDLRYTDDGTTTKIFDVYGFPFSNIDWDTGKKVHHNTMLFFLLGWSGYSYDITGQWSTPK